MKFSDTSIPLTIRMATHNFINNIGYILDIFTQDGVVVDNKNVSIYRLAKSKETHTAIRRLISHNRVYSILASAEKYNEEAEYYESNILKLFLKSSLIIYVLHNEDHSHAVPGIIVADNNGDPYFLFNTNSHKLSIQRSGIFKPEKWKLLPIDGNLWQDIENITDKDNLTKALSVIKSYIIYDVSDYRYNNYFEKVLKNFGYNDDTINLLKDFKYLPLVEFDNDSEFNLNVSSALTKSYKDGVSYIVKTDKPESDSVVVLHKYNDEYDGYSIVLSTLPLPIYGINGSLYINDKKQDMANESEGLKLVQKIVAIKEKENIDTLGGIRLTKQVVKGYDGYKESFNLLIKERNKSLSDGSKKDKETSLIELYQNRVINNDDSLTVTNLGEAMMLADVLYKGLKLYTKDQITNNLNSCMAEKAKTLRDEGKYERLIYLNQLHKYINSK